MQFKSSRMHEICALAPVIPALVVEDVRHARPLAEALVAGGLVAIEVTLRTPAALDVIRAMVDIPGCSIGAGTLVTPRDVQSAKAAGAVFGVSPGATDQLIAACEAEQLPLLPGASTTSEAMTLLEKGYDTLKFFPAEASGGVAALRSISAALPRISFCPSGGITPANAREYFSAARVVCVGGNWVAPADTIKAEHWTEIEALAREAVKLNS
ncbi:bifunctional 4-hydroxy-2-oxoglutarate aldolase/2-dehydro-3-deoxy-phosphogluconate aldolase [Bradyrhizobium tropiciagri]|uniref:bifunctional 4-hydroxy-2-oxoglutarate aldolase/2-dehydro-3-deoxy-phosphogluconate aldolase n=1 Tax=Bradyrhizobium tropiciagri TaxID=312253 RepID=UPI00067AD1E5|nr:bifunctional 4-hydroxy-2-oxoglutarate aldolase/2-dehydro-3-deoxy-phosphogluconate aldolase [Bradyrhizobium tropiciagri]